MMKFNAGLWSFLISLYFVGSAEAYTPPVGIPDPGMWGTTHPIDSPAPITKNKCPGWPSAATPGCYYVDNTRGSATDSSNVYGYPDKPRISIPEITYDAGSYISLNNGKWSGGGQVITTFNGTPENPIWVVGNSAATIIGDWIVKGSYVLFDRVNFSTNSGRLQLRPHNGSSIHHMAFRNSEMVGSGTYGGNSAAVAIYGDSVNSVNNIVVYNNIIHDYGDDEYPTENDFHGIIPTSYSNNIWILNNHIYDNGGDSVQVGSATLTTTARPHHVYIGNNIFHGDRENAIDIKRSQYVVASKNTCYDYAAVSSSSGEAITAHNEPDNVWIINNTVYDSNIGIITTGSTETYFIGNVIYNIGLQAIHFRGASTGGAINNTISGYNTTGISIFVGGLKILNNILDNRIGTTGHDFEFSSTTNAANSIVDNILFTDPDGAKLKVGTSTMSLASFKSTYNKCTSFCQENKNNQFIDPAKYDFRLLDTSVAIDKGNKSDVYSLYLQRFGVALSTDFNGTLRPSGTAYDIGADENGIEVLPALPSPTFLNIFIK